MSDEPDRRRRRGRKLPIAPEAGAADANGLNGPNGPNGEARQEGEAEARPIEPDVVDAPPPAAEAEPSADAEALAAAEAGATDGERPADPEASARELSVKEVPSWRLILTLAAAGAMAGLAIVLVFGWAEPKIEAHRAAALRAAIQEVLGGPERYETLFVVDGSLTTVPPANVDSTELDRIYAGYAADGSQMGFAIAGEQPGYQDIVGLIFGYDAESGQLLGMKVLESKETPGLGDKIEKDSAFVSSFRGSLPPIEGVKAGAGTGSEHEVDMITGATISSRTVIEIINKRMESIGAMIQAYRAETREAPAAVSAEAGG